jgi:hypothetical protein
MGTTGGKRFRRVHRGRKVRREEKGKRDGNTEITEVGTQREERRRKEKKGEERRRKEKKGEERRRKEKKGEERRREEVGCMCCGRPHP